MLLIHDNLALVKSKMAEAAIHAGRSPDEVELVAVTKTVPAEIIHQAFDAGQHLFGENRVQELLSKQPLLPSSSRWHLIGHLQSNKIRKVLPFVEAIHGVDSVELAKDINRIAADLGLFPKIYLEINVAAEASKFGFDPAALEGLMGELLSLDWLKIQGLMCVPPMTSNPEDSRKYFIKLRELRERLSKAADIPLPGLSMGMSGDYVVAVEEGATLVRVGSAIFGSR